MEWKVWNVKKAICETLCDSWCGVIVDVIKKQHTAVNTSDGKVPDRKRGNYIWKRRFPSGSLSTNIKKEIITCKALSLPPSASVNINITLYIATLQTLRAPHSYFNFYVFIISKNSDQEHPHHKYARGYSSRDMSIKTLFYSSSKLFKYRMCVKWEI